MAGKTKIAVIGGGSTYTPELIEGLIQRAGEIDLGEVWLMDIDAERLNIVGDFARRMVEAAKVAFRIELTTDRRAALAGATFVCSQFRVGGMKARDQDIRLGLRHNVVGQETTGVGGFAKALRTIPVTLSICRDMKELCPDAWLINFTNPSGLVTEAVVKHGDGVRAIGLCNVPIGMQMWIAQALHIDPSRVRLDYVGLNHLSWVRHVHIGPLDLMGMAVDNVARIQAMIAERTDEKVFDPAVVKALRMFPSPYLRYYYNTQEMVAEEKNAPKNRAEVVMEIEAELLKLYQDPKLTTKPKELEKRGGAYYSVAAVNLMSSIFNSKGDVQIVNTRNGTCILDLPENVVVEVPCTIDRDGAHPLPVGHVEIAIRGLLQVVKAYEELAIEAAVSGDKRIAYQALLAHPLVGKAHLATVLLNELLEINRPYLPQFKR